MCDGHRRERRVRTAARYAPGDARGKDKRGDEQHIAERWSNRVWGRHRCHRWGTRCSNNFPLIVAQKERKSRFRG